MGALLLLGIPPDQARRVPAEVAQRVIDAAEATRDDVDAFMRAERARSGTEEQPLPLDLYLEPEQPQEKPKRKRQPRWKEPW